MLRELHYIAIEGPIGVGKTSLARALADRLGARLILEPSQDNPFLEKFYADMPRYALATQFAFLVSRYQQQTDLRQPDLFAPMAVSDYLFDKDKIFAGLTLRDDELNLYSQFHEALAARAARPDVGVLLPADVDTLMERIHRRAIPHEAALPREYIARLVAAYNEYFRLYSGAPVLVVETSSVDYATGGIDVAELIAEIEGMESERRLYVPGKAR